MKNVYDVIIIGAGPAGLSAAIYMARARYRVLVLEKEKIGGQITITSEVVNYPGIPKTSGTELTDGMKKQALSFGAEILIANVKEVELEKDIKVIKTDKGEFETFGAILATGASPRKIGFDGESQFRGRGVAYCATCDGEFFQDLDIFVVGGGLAAVEEALFLTKYGKKVTIAVRGSAFTCSGAVVDEVMNHDKIEVRFHTELVKVDGDDNLQSAEFKNNKTGKTDIYQAETKDGFGVFVFAGYEPETSLFKGQVSLNEQGYILTDANRKTNLDGVYGAGDVCVKELRQVVTATADGAIAATSLERFIPVVQKRNNFKREEIKPAEKTWENKNGKSYDEGTFITAAMKQQLEPVFAKFQNAVTIKGYLDDSDVSKEVEVFLKEVESLSDKIQCHYIKEVDENVVYPSLSIYNDKDEPLGIQFHGVPGGHEFNSFIVALYNAAGPGQPIGDEILKKIKAVEKERKIKIVVSLSCTMCPELVMAASRIANENSKVETEIFDLAHYPDIREKYGIKSVPCMIIGEDDVHFGKKDIEQILEILNKE